MDQTSGWIMLMPGPLSVGASSLSLLLALLVVSACDSQPVEEPLPEGSLLGFTDYFPLAVGQVWTFDYEHTCQTCGPGVSPESLQGTLTWQVTDEHEGPANARTYTVQEAFRGTFTRFPHGQEPVVRDSAWITVRAFRLSTETMNLDVYTDGEVDWVEPEAAPSAWNVRFSADTDTLRIWHPVRGFRFPASMRFVKTQGLIRYAATDSHGFGNDLDITLKTE